MADCCDPIIPPSSCPPRCNPLVSTECVIDPTGYACLDIPAESSQSEINAAIIEALCNATIPPASCPTFTNATLTDPLQDLDWENSETSPVGYSNVVNCIVRIRGGCNAIFSATATNAIVSQLFLLPVGHRPSVPKGLSVNIVINPNPLDVQFVALQIPAIIIVQPSGAVIIQFTNFNPFIAVTSSCLDCPDGDPVASIARYFGDAVNVRAFVPLDGLTFDTV